MDIKVGEILINISWTRNYTPLVSNVQVVKINKKTIKAKILTCSGPVWMRGQVQLGEVITLDKATE